MKVDVEQIIHRVMVVGPPRPECGAAERQRALPFERCAMTRGAMLIVKVATVRTLMPYGQPATLSRQEYINIVAYILMVNGYPAGAQPLPLDPPILKRMTIKAATALKRLSTLREVYVRYSMLSAAILVAAGLTQYSAYAANGPTQAELNAAGESTEWLLPNHDLSI